MERNRKEKGRVLDSVAELFDLPADVVAGLPRLELVGDRQLYLEHHTGLLAYSDTQIDANTAAGDGTPPAGQFAGRVADYYDSEANPLFELEIGGRRVLVPAAEEFIAHIDFEGRTMKMILPEGLIDL